MRIVVLTISLALLLTAVTWAWNGPHAPEPKEEYVTYTVQRGDTLWAIAREFGPENTDRRHFIFNIRRLNGLSSANITPGQVLMLPRR